MPRPGAIEVLRALAGRCRKVAVVSGRPLSFLTSRVPSGELDVFGLYGFERLVQGRRRDSPGAERWVGPVAGAAAAARAEGPVGVGVEPKRLSLTLHYRAVPDERAVVEALAADLGQRFGLAVRPARMSVELHPSESPDKGTVVTDLAGGAAAACFLGDDLGDVSAFRALDDLVAAGELALAVRVVAASSETPPELMERADIVVEGAGGAVAWLESLAAPQPRPDDGDARSG